MAAAGDEYRPGPEGGAGVNLRYSVYRAMAALWSLRRPSGGKKRGTRVLMYHAVGSAMPDDTRGIFSLESGLFRSHMEMLAGLEWVRFRHCGRYGDDDGFTGVAVTFDDGYRDNLLVAAPILRELHIPFTIFVCTDPVRAGDPLFLSPGETRRLVADYDVRIGSHGAGHVRLGDCGKRQLERELTESKQYLEDLLGQEVDMISYPHGSVNRRVLDAASEAGYRLGFSSYFGANDAGSDPLCLARIPVIRPDGDDTLKRKIQGDWDWYRWLQQIRRFV